MTKFDSMLCGCTGHIIHAFFYLLFEDFIHIQCWVNPISNCKLLNTFFCVMQIQKILYIWNKGRQLLPPNNGNNEKRWQYLQWLFIVLFSFTNSIILCLHVLTVIMTYWMTFIGKKISNNCLICSCSTSDFLI